METELHQLPQEEALRSLQSGPGGLSQGEARRRLEEYGPNRIEPVHKAPLIYRFFKEFTHFFAIVLWIAAGLAFFVELHGPSEGMGMLGWAIIGVIVVNSGFSFWQEYRAERAVAALQKLLPHEVTVIRDGQATQIAAAELVPGDLVMLEEGDDIPADGRLINAVAMRVNNATVTGESAPLARNAEPCADSDPLHRANTVLAGTSVVGGRGTALVYATGMLTEFGRIAHLTQSAEEGSSPLQMEIRRVSRTIGLLAAVLGVVFFLVGRAMDLPFWDNFLFAIGIIVANVPEGLLPTVTLSLAMASQRMARRNALVRHLASVETLGSATVICTDKTGTLTLNQMTVRRVYVGGRWFDIASEEWRSGHSEARNRLLDVARFCQDVKEVERDGNSLFGTAPINVGVWLFMLPFAIAMMALEDLRKCLVRRRQDGGMDRTTSTEQPARAATEADTLPSMNRSNRL